MKLWLNAAIAAICLLAAPMAVATYHTFRIEQIYSNADGTLQFIVMHESLGANGENLWGGHPLISTYTGATKTFIFPADLPGGDAGDYGYGMPVGATTANKRVLIATEGFAALKLVTPDYVIPNGFLSTSGGTLNYAGVDQITYASLPTNGTGAIDRNGAIIQNKATNFFGQSASVAGGAAQIIPVAGVWLDPSEAGTGYGLDYQNGTLLVAAYSFLPGGAAQWYLAAGAVTSNVFQGTLDKYTGGQCISCMYTGPSTNAGNDGAVTITFTSPTTANIALPGGRIGHIQRYFASGAAQPASAPVAGVWLDPNEAGTGYGLDYQDGTLLVAAYSFIAGGAAQWYLAAGPVTNNVFQGTLDKYSGGQCISCAYTGPPTKIGNDGQVTITFTSPTTANIALPGGRTGHIRRYF